MSPYRLNISDKAKQQIRQVLPEYLRAEIVQSILALQDEPKPLHSELQRELVGRHRLKIDGWRVFYKINEQDKVVTVVEVRRRHRNTYLNVP